MEALIGSLSTAALMSLIVWLMRRGQDRRPDVIDGAVCLRQPIGMVFLFVLLTAMMLTIIIVLGMRFGIQTRGDLLALGVFGVITCALLVCTVTLARQRIVINAESVAVKGLFGKKTILWQEVSAVRFLPRRGLFRVESHQGSRLQISTNVTGLDAFLGLLRTPALKGKAASALIEYALKSQNHPIYGR